MWFLKTISSLLFLAARIPTTGAGDKMNAAVEQKFDVYTASSTSGGVQFQYIKDDDSGEKFDMISYLNKQKSGSRTRERLPTNSKWYCEEQRSKWSS